MPHNAPQCPTVRFSLSLSGRVPVEQPPPQSSCRPAGGGVKCVWSFVTDSLIFFSGVLKPEKNRSWAKEQNMISCYQLDDLGPPWQQFESLSWWKSPLRPSRNFWKVARINYITILSGHNDFQEIRPKKKALKLIWSCWQDKCLSEFDGIPCRHQSAWRQDGDRHTGDTNSLDVCRF